MTPPVYTVLIGNVSLTPGHVQTLGPLPANYRWVVKSIALRFVNDPAPETLGVQAGTFLGQIFAAWQCPPYGRRQVHWTGWEVVDDLDSLVFTCGGFSGDPGQVTGRVTGQLLSLP